MSIVAPTNQRAASHARTYITAHTLTVAVVLLAILAIRLIDLDYNTAFVDEAIYIINGQQALQGTSGFVAVRYMFGSYLYPVLAALFGQLFGNELLGARVLSALYTTLAAGSIYVFTRRVINPFAGVCAMIIFGFAANSRLVGQLATYDTLGVALTAVLLMLLGLSLTDDNSARQERLMFYAGVAFAASVLAKYIVLLLAPALVLVVLGLLWRCERALVWRLARAFALPVVAILFAYGTIFLDDLLRFVAGVSGFSSQPAPRAQIIQAVRDALWPYILLALLGTTVLFIQRNREARLAAIALLVAGAILPVYHSLAGNIRSLDKHVVYSLVMLAPLCGAAVALIWQWLTRRAPQVLQGPVAQAALAAALVVGCFMAGNQTASNLKLLWPNMTLTLDVLRGLPMPQDTRVLAEGGPMYTLYLDWGDRVKMTDTWATAFSYKSLRGEPAMLAAVKDGEFEYIILDSYYTQGLSYQLGEAARNANYQIVHIHDAVISNGSTITTTIYASPNVTMELNNE